MLKTDCGEKADFSKRELGINVPTPRMLKDKQSPLFVRSVFSACLLHFPVSPPSTSLLLPSSSHLHHFTFPSFHFSTSSIFFSSSPFHFSTSLSSLPPTIGSLTVGGLLVSSYTDCDDTYPNVAGLIAPSGS